MPTSMVRGALLLLGSLLLAGCAGLQSQDQINYAHCRLVGQAAKAEKFDVVLQEADLCLEKNQLSKPMQSLVYWLKSDAYANFKRYPQAIAAKEKSIELDGTPNARAVLDLSRLYREAGNPQKALELVQSNLDANLGEAGKGAGFNMPTYYHLGQALYDLGQYREAAEAYSAGLQRQPDYAWAFYHRGLAYEKLGLADDARGDFSSFAKLVDQQYVEPQHQAKLAEYKISLP
ncbi:MULTISPECIES: tetratricopeptide repeat protein [Pseudomonas]|uniref:Tetratricopeptide repeat protein n=1 Tax=Pseudomonas sessilinigenes TaxID=658629 RepID=A0ABX8MR41_9PSED|nr:MULTISPECIES: tetratricopeptide repeat protein [Pseudomonas]AZC22026.1 TPR domain protein [Pseudomonas sessilinigenes]QIH05644.1 tetratricopeptide repeat protein [Pseudomonas sp. BIOMIG1BAC]QXH41123.1 tetratricopeptide repeat protein [Pseudomonas sessilinigenes]